MIARLPDLLRKMSPVDLLIVEGFKSEPYRKIEVHRKDSGKPPLFPDDPAVACIASDCSSRPSKRTWNLPYVRSENVS